MIGKPCLVTAAAHAVGLGPPCTLNPWVTDDTAALIHNAMSIMNYLVENYVSNLTEGGVNLCWNALFFWQIII